MLSRKSAEVVRATLPAVKQHIVAIAGVFYDTMFADHPELLDLFNRGNQANGDQRRALAGAVVAYAEHATGAGVVAMGSVVGRIAHKHASLGIRPSQYPLVGRYLLTAVATVLGDAVTPGVAAAWDEVYWLMAVRLIETEARLYQEAGVDLADPAHRWRVAARRDEGGDVVSLFLIPVEGTVPPHLPGQFVTVDVDLPGGGRQARQYTVSRAAGHRELRISVRRVRGAGGAPDGLVSTALTRDLRIGDEVRVSHPFGDAVLADDDRPLLLASAGIGITQTAALLEHVARHQPRRPVTVVHAERHPDRYALFHDIEFHGARLTSFRHLAFYDTDAPTDVTRGPVRLDSVDVPDGVTAHLCGPVPFMRDIRAALLARGVSGENVHIEVFGPDLWTTGADRLPGVAAAV